MTMRALLPVILLATAGCVGGAVSAKDPAETDGGPTADADAEPGRWGAVDVTLVYDGVRRLRGADLYLLEGSAAAEACPAVDPAPPADAIGVVSLVDALVQTARFAELTPGTRVVVVAVALDDTGIVTARGCSAALEVRTGVNETLVPLTDVPVSLDGVWEVDSELRISEGLPLGTRLVLELLEEMTDDANDPATFLLDLLVAQFIEDESLRTALSWVRQSAGIDRGLNERIRVYAPALLVDVLDASGELAHALDHLRVDSRLTVERLDPDGGSVAEHELLDLVFDVEDVQTRFSIARDVGVRDTSALGVDVGLDPSGRVDVGAHEFQVGLGTVALFALREVVLPRLDGAPRSMGELLGMLVDCRDVGAWLAEATGMGSVDDWEDACARGLTGIGATLELQILAEDERFSTLTLVGHAVVDGKLQPHALEEGAWEATWSGTGEELPFGGTFAAQRIPSRVVE